MILAFLWAALGYASCVWDFSCNPEHSRWPSATGVFILLLAMRHPRYGIWGAAACGLFMDAGQGGLLGPRVLAGVAIAAVAGYSEIGRAETKWPRVALLVFVLSFVWISAPKMDHTKSRMSAWANAIIDQEIVLQAVSTALVTLAIRSLLRPVVLEDEAHW